MPRGESSIATLKSLDLLLKFFHISQEENADTKEADDILLIQMLSRWPKKKKKRRRNGEEPVVKS